MRFDDSACYQRSCPVCRQLIGESIEILYQNKKKQITIDPNDCKRLKGLYVDNEGKLTHKFQVKDRTADDSAKWAEALAVAFED